MNKSEGVADERKPAAQFTKSQLVAAKRYSPTQRDVMNALLEEGKSYSHDEVQAIIKQFSIKEAR